MYAPTINPVADLQHPCDQHGVQNVCFLVPVLNEVDSLTTTVNQILALCPNAVGEVLIIVGNATTAESRHAAQELQESHRGVVRMIQQERPFLGGALRTGIAHATSEFVMMMASDLETDPADLPRFVQTQLATNADIVAASRWKPGGGFAPGYGAIKKRLNQIFQFSLRVLFRAPLSDFTYGFRLYRRSVLNECDWSEVRHPFLLESLLLPLMQGAEIREIPSIWNVRSEGTSSNSWSMMVSYWQTAIRIRQQYSRKSRVCRINE